MATQPIRTATSKQIIEALDEHLRFARENTDGEMDTYTRMVWTAKVDTLKLVISIVRGLLPYVEVDAVMRAMPGIGMTEAEFLLGDPADVPDDTQLSLLVVA